MVLLTNNSIYELPEGRVSVYKECSVCMGKMLISFMQRNLINNSRDNCGHHNGLAGVGELLGPYIVNVPQI